MKTLLANTGWMTLRRLRALARQPGVLVLTLVQPVIWLLLFGSLFKKVAELPGFGAASYMDYVAPGVVVMSAVSSSMWSGMGIIDEIDRGTLNRFLVSPVHRSAILNAGVIENAVTTTVQSLIIVLLAWFAGAHYPGGAVGIVILVVASILLGTVFSALSNTMGLLVRQRESIIGLSVFLLLPLTFLSTAFMARALMPGWIQAIAGANPLNWSLSAARGALTAHPDWSAVTVHGGGLLVLAVAMVWLSTGAFRSYQKSL